jgi:hypothetical protein
MYISTATTIPFMLITCPEDVSAPMTPETAIKPTATNNNVNERRKRPILLRRYRSTPETISKREKANGTRNTGDKGSLWATSWKTHMPSKDRPAMMEIVE